MKTKLILHGHFYQPPRENPETGLIDIQPSAAPWNNWNEKIADQCYNANAFSRYIPDGRHISKLVNNYSYMSFNFGPTLLEWLEKYQPETVEKIKEADSESLRRLGHGNAIAQSYNHTILPLDPPDRRDKQIEWGLESFRRTFNRDAEGLWCPESAINPDVVDSLVSFGIRFVILSPFQAGAVEDESGKMIDVSSTCAPYMRPYILEGKSAEIPAFFYHPGLASGISFDHYLRDADKLYKILLDIRDKDKAQLIHAATDGEVYGHHEPFGDMAMAALIEKVTARQDFELTNYAAVLDESALSLHARLKSGEEKMGTSWSCSHGVGRWMRDCGCYTGGSQHWNQKWRTPLRKATEMLWSEITGAFSKELSGLKIDSKTVLSFGYKPADPYICALLAGYRYASFSATSCGWFFNDISGIETKQNIAYALKAIDIYSELCPGLREKYLDILEDALSNDPKEGTGRDIALAIEQSTMKGSLESAAFFNIADTLNKSVSRYGRWQKIKVSPDIVTVEDTDSGEQFSVSVSECGNYKPSLIMEGKIDVLVANTIGSIFDGTLNNSQSACSAFSEAFQKKSLIPGEEAVRTMVVGTAMHSLRSLFKSKNPNLKMISKFLSVIEKCGNEKDLEATAGLMTQMMIKLFHTSFGKIPESLILNLLKTSREAGIEPSLTKVQNLFWAYTDNGRKLEGRSPSDPLVMLAEDLNFSVRT